MSSSQVSRQKNTSLCYRNRDKPETLLRRAERIAAISGGPERATLMTFPVIQTPCVMFSDAGINVVDNYV